MNVRTTGIVIKRMNFGEADRLLTILTERFGKVKAVAKGVRKIKSKLAGSLEPFMLLDLQLYEGKTLYTVTGAVIQNEFPRIHSMLKKTSECFYVAELVDKILEENQKSEKIFEIFKEALKIIENNERKFLLRIIELQIIEASGFKPELYQCLHCGEKLKLGQNFWDSIEGGVICSLCQEKFHHGREISNDLIKIFRLIDQGKFEMVKRIKVDSPIEKEAEEILSQYLKSVLEREIKSEKFMRQVNNHTNGESH